MAASSQELLQHQEHSEDSGYGGAAPTDDLEANRSGESWHFADFGRVGDRSR